MSDAFPPSTSSSHVSAMASLVRYPPEYFCSGAAGFRHVSTVLNDLALAASSVQTALPSAKSLPLTTGPQLNGQREGERRTLRRRGAQAPYSAMRDSRGYSTWRALIVRLSRPPNMLLADLSVLRIAYPLRPRSASWRRILVVAMKSMWATGRPCVSINSLQFTQATSRTKISNIFLLVSVLPAQKISVAETSTSRTNKIDD